MEKTTVPPKFTILPEEHFKELQRMIHEIYHQKKEEIKLKDYISKDKACIHFGWGEATWYRLRRDGLIKVRRIGKKQYLRISEIERTLEEGLI